MTATAYLATATAAALAVLALAAPASADMRLGMQDDVAMLENPTAYLDRADQVDAQWVRIMVMDNRWPLQAEQYVNAVATAKARGKNVMVSLLAWHTHPTPAEWRAFAERVVPRLAPYVDAWSPMNESNWPGMAPQLSTRCVESGSPSMVAKRSRAKAERRWKRVRRGKGRFVRRVKHRRSGAVVVRYRRAQTRNERRRARWVRTRRAPRKTVYVTSTTQRRQCDAEAYGSAYRRVWDEVAPVLATDAGAQLVVGDVAPMTSDRMLEFMQAFYKPGQPAVRPDVLGDHYPDAQRARWVVDYARPHGLTPWVTEWAQSAWDKFHPDIHSTPGDWARALRELAQAGMRVTMIYDAAGPTWDTRMRDDDLAAVAARHGGT